MALAPLFNPSGEQIGQADLSDAVFGQEIRVDLLHQAVERELSNRRQGTHSTKSRSEVRGGGKKPYRQKGTGRARQGSIRAPHYRHGGVAHGPSPRDYYKAMPQKMRRAAFRSALSAKAGAGSLRVVETMDVPEISTKRFAEWLGRFVPEDAAPADVTPLDPAPDETARPEKAARPEKIIIVLAERDENAALSARNLPNVRVVVLPGLSTYQVTWADTLILTRDAVARVEELYSA